MQNVLGRVVEGTTSLWCQRQERNPFPMIVMLCSYQAADAPEWARTAPLCSRLSQFFVTRALCKNPVVSWDRSYRSASQWSVLKESHRRTSERQTGHASATNIPEKEYHTTEVMSTWIKLFFSSLLATGYHRNNCIGREAVWRSRRLGTEFQLEHLKLAFQGW